MKRFFKIILMIVFIFILIAGCGVFYLGRGLEAGSKVIINGVDASSLNDGTYNGKYKAGRWSNEVKVIIKNHKITNIDVVKDVALSKSEVKSALLKRVIEKQNTDVDVVSGATVTSKAYLKSIENALKK